MTDSNKQREILVSNENSTERDKLNREFKRVAKSLPRQKVTQADLAAMIKHDEW
ncbi:hypothetical protein [Weissella sagaensis]|jgi:hypothetical protein|uniref:hypothetical protein n=1 Tax=Weissella sagaensis TaxID=2559928 RepID=UPI0013E9B4A8|nr:hypothetical protein [Weissella sagaensis]